MWKKKKSHVANIDGRYITFFFHNTNRIRSVLHPLDSKYSILLLDSYCVHSLIASLFKDHKVEPIYVHKPFVETLGKEMTGDCEGQQVLRVKKHSVVMKKIEQHFIGKNWL